ncbi:MAG: HAD-IIB family hydrolase, partial [Erysipelotrichaceae bacterium]|nr:HAD-IIB family hydrolase [Erysipelotrichaceae bacterium]
YPFDGYITCNGNFCYSGDQIVYAKPVPKKDLLEATKFALEKDYAVFFCMEKDAFVTMYNDRVRALEELFGYKVDVTSDTSRIEKEDCYMLVTYCGQDKTKEILAYMPNCKGTSWHEITTDIINTDSGKGDGIAHVLEYYGLTKEESMAFGDGDNDIEMLDAVKYPIVMDNALEHVKTHGIYTTGTVETEGITTALKHFKLI